MRLHAFCTLAAGLLGPGGLASAQIQPAERRLGFADRIPLPLTVVPEIELPRGNWKHNAGWAPHDLEVQHAVEGGVLVVKLLDGDGYCAAPLELYLVADSAGRLSVSASGGSYGCTRKEPFVDLHGEVRVEERNRASAEPLRVTFRVDALDRGLLPLRTEGAVAIPLSAGEWEHDICPSQAVAEGRATLREVLWRWPDGSPRALGMEDGAGLRQGL